MKYLLRDRFMFVILLGIILLVLVALILFFTRQQGQNYLDQSTPAGVVNNYVLALQRGHYDRAYTYLANTSNRPGLLIFQSFFSGYQVTEVARTAVEINETVEHPDGSSAMVYITLVRSQGGLFGEFYRDSGTVWLVKEAGAWRITDFPHPFWTYNTEWR